MYQTKIKTMKMHHNVENSCANGTKQVGCRRVFLVVQPVGAYPDYQPDRVTSPSHPLPPSESLLCWWYVATGHWPSCLLQNFHRRTDWKHRRWQHRRMLNTNLKKKTKGIIFEKPFKRHICTLGYWEKLKYYESTNELHLTLPNQSAIPYPNTDGGKILTQ